MPPAWAASLDADEYAAFRALVIDHLGEWFVPFDEGAIDEGRVDVKLDFVREVQATPSLTMEVSSLES